MNQKNILIGIGALLIGIIASGAFASYAVNGNHRGMMSMYAMHDNSASDENTSDSTKTQDGMTMDEMATSLKDKSGDAFDKAFLSEMIVHHQGAIDMANLALSNAKHQEVKDLANAIISAQNNEISQMKTWQSQWNYSSNSMMNDNTMMNTN